MAKQTCSYDRPEFTATWFRQWLAQVAMKTPFIEPASPWEYGYIESFHGKLRDELLNGEIFETILEAKVLEKRWRVTYNTIRPHSAQPRWAISPRHRIPSSHTSPINSLT